MMKRSLQVSKVVEELCEIAALAGQQPEGETNWQTEVNAERGKCLQVCFMYKEIANVTKTT